jgi:hypothetical protein
MSPSNIAVTRNMLQFYYFFKFDVDSSSCVAVIGGTALELRMTQIVVVMRNSKIINKAISHARKMFISCCTSTARKNTHQAEWRESAGISSRLTERSLNLTDIQMRRKESIVILQHKSQTMEQKFISWIKV